MLRASLVILFLLAACGSTSTPGNSDAGALHGSVSVLGEPDLGLGIFDPSISYALGADAGQMVYSVVSPDQSHVHSEIAGSSDHGATWTYIGAVNAAAPGTISNADSSVCGSSTCTGTVINEVPSLLVDPNDSADRLYKVFTHRYFVDSVGDLHYDVGHLALYTAPSPSGPWVTTPLLGWNGVSTFSSSGVLQNISTDLNLAGLSHCVVLTEPGALIRGSANGTIIDLAVGCIFVLNGDPAIEIDLVRSIDHAQSFSFVSTLLSATDATRLGSISPQINAADLFESGGTTYLFATPGGIVTLPAGSGPGYRGCLQIPLADLDGGAVSRDDAGTPMVVESILGATGQFIGACTEAEGASAAGVLGDVLEPALDSPFAIFSDQ